MIPTLPDHPRVVLDACVLYPTVVRSLLIGVAGEGLFRPIWSARLLEEWARAAARRGPLDETQARAEIALLRERTPEAERPPAPGVEARLWLPDANDVHVLATAIDASADILLTWNARDFPRATLAEEGIARLAPDEFLMALWLRAPEAVARAAEAVRRAAERHDAAFRPARAAEGVTVEPHTVRSLLKKARLPRIAKALGS